MRNIHHHCRSLTTREIRRYCCYYRQMMKGTNRLRRVAHPLHPTMKRMRKEPIRALYPPASPHRRQMKVLMTPMKRGTPVFYHLFSLVQAHRA